MTAAPHEVWSLLPWAPGLPFSHHALDVSCPLGTLLLYLQSLYLEGAPSCHPFWQVPSVKPLPHKGVLSGNTSVGTLLTRRSA